MGKIIRALDGSAWTVNKPSTTVTLKPFEVGVPNNNTPSDIPPFVRLVTDKRLLAFRRKRAVLKVSKILGAGGAKLFAPTEVVQKLGGEGTVNAYGASEISFLLYRVLNDREQRLTLYGLLAGLAAVVIDGSMAIGKEHALFVLPATLIALLVALSALLKGFALLVAFLKVLVQR
jgi:hypothetical protein